MVMSLVSLQQGNVKKSEKSMKIVTTRAIAMKFSGKTWLIIILKVTKKKGFTLSLENKYMEKTQEGSN